MSELEILRRQEYKRNRKKWTLVQLVAIAVLISMALISFLIYSRMNRTQYIEYTEVGGIDYKVQYDPNSFFEEEWLGKEQTYISSLTNGITADFSYKMNTSSNEMKFDYKYSINAKLLIANKEKGTPYYTYEEVIVPQAEGRVENEAQLAITESAIIDYDKYNSMAKSFVDTYGLQNVSSCTLIVSLDVNTVCSNNGYDDRNTVVYSTSLNVPLVVDSYNIHRSSIAPEGEVKGLEYAGSASKTFFLTVSIFSALLAALFGLILLAFLHLTNNEDITYAAKVRKILRAYGSFIQRMEGEFDCTGYQTVTIKTFVEMLGIRDTIQSPVLMSENRDETMTRFFVPTATKILYIFEIKVDNYDQIYGTYDDNNNTANAGYAVYAPEPIVTPVAPAESKAQTVAEAPAAAIEPIEEAPVLVAPVEIAPIEVIVEPTPAEEGEAPAAETVEGDAVTVENIIDNIVEIAPDADGDNGEEILAYIDEQGNIVRITCSRSFTANLIQADPKVREYYNSIKNHILSYKGVKARMSWRNESYNKGRIQLFKMKIRGKTICLYCALDPNLYETTKYFHEVATAKKYASVPMMVRIKSDRGLKRAKELVDDVMKNFVILPDPKAQETDYVVEHPYDTTKNLVKRGLIKLLLPDAILSEPKHETKAEEPAVDDAPAPVEEAPTEEVELAEAEAVVTDAATVESIIDNIVEIAPDADGENGGEEILAYIDEQGNIVKITCSRSFTANLIQADPRVREYYNNIKNHILSYKGVKARMSWRNESYNKGRIQLFKMKIRGKTICLYCALDPELYESTKYFHEVATAKKYAKVPMMVRIKSDRGLKRAKELVDDVMRNFVILPDPKAQENDYVQEHPYDTTKNLVKRGLIKLLLPDATLSEPKHKPLKAEEPKAEEIAHESVTLEVVEDNTVVEEIVLFENAKVDEAVIEEIVAEPTPELDEIDFDDASEEVVDFVETKEHPGVDVIGVVWPERAHKNKIYRYDPNGEDVTVGDVVIVPTRDVHSNKDVVRKAAVAHANHKVPNDELKHPLKKIVGVIRKKIVTELQSIESDKSEKTKKTVKSVRVKKEKKTKK